MKAKAVAAVFVCLLEATTWSCDTGTTTGQRVTLHAQIQADPEIDDAFTSETGWSVRLRKAVLSLGALYYFDGHPAFVRHPRSALEQLAFWLAPSVVFAHPGHYASGMALGQMTHPEIVELRSEPTRLRDGVGVTGTYRSARLTLAEPATDTTPIIANGVALVEGTASKEGTTVAFRLSTSLADVARSVSKGEIDGCRFDEVEVEGDGTVLLTVKPRIWFNLVDFNEVAPGSPEAPTTIVAGATAQIAFALGVAQLSAYHFSYTAKP